METGKDGPRLSYAAVVMIENKLEVEQTSFFPGKADVFHIDT